MQKQGEKVTIKDIAEALGVSFSTVAKALNDDPRISDQTKTMVKKKAQEMHYVRNYFAHSLRHQESYTIAIILSDIDIPVYAEMITKLYPNAHKSYDLPGAIAGGTIDRGVVCASVKRILSMMDHFE